MPRARALEPSIPRDSRLWLSALLGSLLLNGLLLLGFAFLTLSPYFKTLPAENKSIAPKERLIQLTAVRVAPPAPTAAAEEAVQRFARTSPSQAAARSEKALFIGERNTQATSNRAAIEDAPPMPSLAGQERKDDEIETTESNFQDGNLQQPPAAAAASPTTPPNPAQVPNQPAPKQASERNESIASAEELESKPKLEALADGPFPVQRPVTEVDDQADVAEQPKPAESEQVNRAEKQADPKVAEAIKPPNTASPSDPGFRGNQRRTALKGSISRRGQAALEVEDSALGRYYASLSRAFEQSWQRQVIANRDYITPGVIRVRVVLGVSGEVRSVGTVDEFGIGMIQRGFTLGSIREAKLPPMPTEVKQELNGEPLELLYNFIF